MYFKFSAISTSSLLFLLAGCATPLEQCINTVQAEYRNTLALRAETNANIARGYALHTQSVPYQYTSVCYNPYVGSYSCQQTGYRTQETPVAIDVNLERQKLRELDRLLPRLEQEASIATEQCRVTYPEDES